MTGLAVEVYQQEFIGQPNISYSSTLYNKRNNVRESPWLQIISYLGLIMHLAMETCGRGGEAQSHAFWTSLLDGSWVCAASMCETALCVRWVGSPSRCEWV